MIPRRLDDWMGRSILRTFIGIYVLGCVICAPVIVVALLWNRYVA